MKTSVIIPVYNEEKIIGECLESLSKQTKPIEIIVVDDGSTDSSKFKVQSLKLQSKNQNLKLLGQKHLGPGAARNLGAQKANGDILVFVDSDMTFASDFVEKLIAPIEMGKTKGTFTKSEYVANWDNVWARCWNYNQDLPDKNRLSSNYPDTAPVFRAILKNEFLKVQGFTEGVGWTDDWTLSKKLRYQSTATTALCYHHNPSTLSDVFTQARWIGKNEFLSRSFSKTIISLCLFSLPVSLVSGFTKSFYYQTPKFLLFKLVYDTAVILSLLEIFFTSNKNK